MDDFSIFKVRQRISTSAKVNVDGSDSLVSNVGRDILRAVASSDLVILIATLIASNWNLFIMAKIVKFILHATNNLTATLSLAVFIPVISRHTD